MIYDFLIDSYETERIKVLAAWAMFRDEDLPLRPNASEDRGRSVLEQMVHQCVSENLWFRNILGIDVGAPPLPGGEHRGAFIERYAEDSGRRLIALRSQLQTWFEEEVRFFDVDRSRAWVLTRRMTHTAHHRGQLLGMLRMLGRDLYSTYGPTADTGGLMQHGAPTIYGYDQLEDLLAGGAPRPFPRRGSLPVTERPPR